METLLQLISDYWVIIILLVGSIIVGYKFIKNPNNEQMNKAREWLIYACMLAEKEIGSGTGQLKLRYVYDLFTQRFKWVSMVISFEAFSKLVDEALIVIKHELETNININHYIKKGE